MDRSLWLALWATMMSVHVKTVTSQNQCCPVRVYETGVHVVCPNRQWASFQWSERGAVYLQETDKEICWKGEQHKSDATFAIPKPTTPVVLLDLSFNVLTDFPDLSRGIFGGLYHLNLSHNNIQHVTPALLRSVPRLRSLDLSYNSLTDFPVTSPVSFAELHHLNLSHNELQHLSTALLRSTSRLQTLDLSFNRLSLVPEFPKVQLPELNFFDMSHNALQEIPGRGFQGLYKLETLLVGDNQVGHLASDSLFDLGALRVLELHANRLKSLTRGVFDELSRLMQLDLHGNALEALLKDTLKAVTELRALNLSDNKLNDMPLGSLRSLSSLQRLDLSCNQLDSLSGGLFEGLDSLQHLTLSHNEVRAISVDTFKGLNTLKDLDLRHNQLSTIRKASFTHMKKLHQLNLKSNSLKQLHEHVFAGLKWLEHLDLSDNKLQLDLQSLPEEVFSPLHNLRTLLIHGNDARTSGLYPVSVFARLQSISHLSMDTFTDTTFPPGGISALPRLRKLDLPSCKLTSVKEDTFRGFSGSSLEQIRLSDCPLRSVEECAFCGLQKLELLSITNSFSSAPVSMAGRVLDAEDSSLRHLNLSGIKLNDDAVQALADGTLKGLRRLEVLDLSGNQLQNPNLTVSPGLKKLLLSRNQLWAVPDMTAGERLMRLDLSHNNVALLTAVQRAAMDRLADTPHGFTLLLHGNSLPCPKDDCMQMDFWAWLCSTHVALGGGDTPGRDIPCVTHRDHVVTVGEALEECEHRKARKSMSFAVAVAVMVVAMVVVVRKVCASGNGSGTAAVSLEAEDDIMEPELSLPTAETGYGTDTATQLSTTEDQDCQRIRYRSSHSPPSSLPSHSHDGQRPKTEEPMEEPAEGLPELNESFWSSMQGRSATTRSSPDQGYVTEGRNNKEKMNFNISDTRSDSPGTQIDITSEESLEQSLDYADTYDRKNTTVPKVPLPSDEASAQPEQGSSHKSRSLLLGNPGGGREFRDDPVLECNCKHSTECKEPKGSERNAEGSNSGHDGANGLGIDGRRKGSRNGPETSHHTAVPPEESPARASESLPGSTVMHRGTMPQPPHPGRSCPETCSGDNYPPDPVNLLPLHVFTGPPPSYSTLEPNHPGQTGRRLVQDQEALRQ